jgi:ABC-type multidrug transport system permease subunit
MYWARILLDISAAIAVLTIVLYQIVADWWKTVEGRHVMSYMACLAVLLCFSVYESYVIPPKWFLWVHLALFTTLPMVLGWRFWLLVQYQIVSWKEREEKK